MTARLATTCALALLLAAPAAAQEVIIVNENFDSYGTDAAGIDAFRAKWVPVSGGGTRLADAAEVDRSRPIDAANVLSVPDVQGTAIAHLGAITSPGTAAPFATGLKNQWEGVVDQFSGEEPAFKIMPSATQAIFLSADIYESAASVSAQERMSVGLRHTHTVADNTVTPADADTFPDVVSSNLIELGLWNAAVIDPTIPQSGATAYSNTSFAARAVLFSTTRNNPTVPTTPTLTAEPNWQYFKLPQELDTTNFGGTSAPNGLVNLSDIGAGWHRYTATITQHAVTFTIDLFRDGLRNTSITPDGTTGIRPGEPGLDAVMVWPIDLVSTANNEFNNLHIGGPSGVASGGPGTNAFDNIVLKLIPVPTTIYQKGDFNYDAALDANPDTDVDGLDFLIWQRGYGSVNQRNGANGDADLNQTVNEADLTAWANSFGVPGLPVSSSVPEPAAAAMALVALAALAKTRRTS